jgi:hypothetical protein
MHEAFAITALARYQARQAVKLQYRAAGRRATSIKFRELQEDADRYLAENREQLMEWARHAVTKIKTSRTKSKR